MVCQTSRTSTAEITRLEVSIGARFLRETLRQLNHLILLQVSIYTDLERPTIPGRTAQELLVRAQEEERRAVIF